MVTEGSVKHNQIRRQAVGVLAFLPVALASIVLESCHQPTDGPPSKPPVVVAQSIVQPTTWKGNGRVYEVEANISVNADLTIQPGAIVKFAPIYSMTLGPGGSIEAVGTASSPIVFTSLRDDSHGGDTNGDGGATQPEPGDWGGVDTNGQNSSVFEYCEFLYGGNSEVGAGYALGITGGSMNTTVTHSVFAFNGGSPPLSGIGALDAAGAGSGTTIVGNAFYSNQTPLSIDTSYSLDNSNVFYDPSGKNPPNACNAISVDPGFGVSTAINWAANGIAYVITQFLSINPGGTLTLASGVVVKPGPSVEIDIDQGGTLNGVNTNVFTSFKDDSIGGDSDCDNGASSPAAGDWMGIYDYNLNAGNGAWVPPGTNIMYAAN